MPYTYKYLPPDRCSFLENGLLRFSPPDALNDPFECLPALPPEIAAAGLKYLERELKKPLAHSYATNRFERRQEKKEQESRRNKILSRYSKNPSFFSDEFYKHASENLNKKIGILSLSRRWNSALMWSHYTASHTGFCVGFKREHEFFLEMKENKSSLLPVKYSDTRTSIKNERFNTLESMAVLLTKSSDWSYEQEERMITTLDEAKTTIDASPYNISLFEVPHDSIAELIIGIKSDEKIKKAARTIAKSLKIPLYQAKISDKSFDIERIKIIA